MRERSATRYVRPIVLKAKHKDTAEIIRFYREPPVPVKEVFDMMDAHANRMCQ